MIEFTPYSALIGGGLIGLISVVFLYGMGRILGLSGFVHGCVRGDFGQAYWRLAFLVGLLFAGVIGSFAIDIPYRVADMHPLQVLIAGLLVGIGTRIGSGCTSGHGVCGLGRRSLRSLVAVCVFMLTAIVVVGVQLEPLFVS